MHAYIWFAVAFLSLLSSILIGAIGAEGVCGCQLPVCDCLLSFLLAFSSVFFYLTAIIERPPKMDMKKKHVLVTGLKRKERENID